MRRLLTQEWSETTTYTRFYKNIVFPVGAEYSYFSADFKLKIFLYEYSQIIAYDIFVIFVFECILCLDGIQEKSFWCQPAAPLAFITSFRKIISITPTASAVFVAFWLLLPFREKTNFIRFR